MFDQIAGSYDFLNHLLSLNLDRRWRKKAIRLLADHKPRRILDVATGTADLAIEAARLNPEMIVGVDVSSGMLELGRMKVQKLGLDDRINFIQSACENLPFDDHSFDAATVAFGVRNFADPGQGLGEIFRVLRPGGMLVVLEFSLPRNALFLNIYRFYFHRILPAVGKWLSKDLEAYRYLPDSVESFPKGEQFTAMLKATGFTHCSYRGLTGGICGLYSGIKNG